MDRMKGMRGRQVGMAVVALGAWMGAIAVAAALSAGQRAPEIRGKDLSGRPFRLSSLQGKVVVVDFWATWCAPCKEELPKLERLYRKYRGKGLVVVGVSVDRDAGKVRRFVEELGLTFPTIHDRGGQRIAARYAPPRMPSTYVIDKRGIVRHVHGGYRRGDERRLEREVKALLAK